MVRTSTNYIILGATGSIGTQALDIIRSNNYKLVAFSYGYNTSVAMDIIEEFKPLYVSTKDENGAKLIQAKYPDVVIYTEDNGNNIIASLYPNNATVINALVGSVGLMPTSVAIETGHDVLLANKETLVIGGEIIKTLVKEKGVNLIPIDSEHSAIYQLLKGQTHKEINKVILTASGGPFRTYSKDMLEHVTVEDALKHPNWKMGSKITIDSATLMNKGFEVIEAYHLFDLNINQIETIIHPESIIHSMVEFKDYSIFAQMGPSDMHLAINYAINGPKHVECDILKPLDLSSVGTLHFEKLDLEKYQLVNMAYNVIEKGGFYPTVLNASNEACVELFLNKKISFTDIEKIILNEMSCFDKCKCELEFTIDNILKLDQEIKNKIKNMYECK